MAEGITVNSSKITFWNIELSVASEDGKDLGTVDVIRYRKNWWKKMPIRIPLHQKIF